MKIQGIWGKVIGVILTIIGAVLSWALVEILDFKQEWELDEAIVDEQKETLMFDSPQQKVEVIQHPTKVPADEYLINKVQHENFEKTVLEAIKRQDCLMTRLNDQYYQLNQKVEKE